MKSMHRLLLPLLLGSLAIAQDYTAHPIDNLASSTSQNIPFAGNNAAWDEARSQFLFLAAFLPTTGGVITSIELVPNTTGATPYERFEIWMDHTTNSTLSTTFANNLTNPTLVYAQSPGSISWVGNTWTSIPLTTPFVYDGTSNLVIEVRKKIDRINNPPTATVSHRVLVWPRRADLPVPIWAYGAYGSGAVDAAVASTTYNTQVLMRLQWAGAAPTLTIDSSRDVTGNANRSYFHLGATITLTSQGAPAAFYLQAIDFGLLPAGFPVPGVNGEVWLTSANTFATGFLDGSGRASSTIAIPNNSGLVGVRTFFQGATVGATLDLSNVVDAPLAAY